MRRTAVTRGPGWWHAAAVAGGDVLGAAGIVLCLPVVILAVGTPIALAVRAVLWIVGIR